MRAVVVAAAVAHANGENRRFATGTFNLMTDNKTVQRMTKVTTDEAGGGCSVCEISKLADN